jgi:hypothetical protein
MLKSLTQAEERIYLRKITLLSESGKQTDHRRDEELDVARLTVVVAPARELCDYLSLPFNAPYADFQALTLLVVSFCCRGAVTDLWSSRIAGRLADT